MRLILLVFWRGRDFRTAARKYKRISVSLLVCCDRRVPSHHVRSKLSVWHLCQFIQTLHYICTETACKFRHDSDKKGEVYDLYCVCVRCGQSFTTAWDLDQNAVRLAVCITSAKLFKLWYRTSIRSVCAYLSQNASVI